MKIKALLATLIGAVALNGATAGDWCPPAPDKCPVDCCEELNGSISVGYDTAYVWKGVRFARDSMWGDVNYTFDLPCVGLPVNVGVWHLTSLGSGPLGNDAYGDETNVYASVELPSICGFDHGVGYTWYTYPTTNTLPASISPDSFSAISYSISREIFCGVSLSYMAEYFTGQSYTSDWFHTIGLSKTIDLTDCLALDVSAEVAYSDELWSGTGFTHVNAANGVAHGSGWNHYKITAALPIAVGKCATLTPYISYNGTPDGWVADDMNGGLPAGANRNDVFFGGVSLSVGF